MSKTIVAIIVYTRFENLQTWLKCWSMCDQTDAELLIIHNNDNNIHEQRKYAIECAQYQNVTYHARLNRGMDIGALKDVCTGVIKLKYDNLLWITDDTIPMSKDFVKQFTDVLSDIVGISCMEMSDRRSELHVRTTGFCMKRETAERLVFPDNIRTKEHCYHFEHRGGDMTMYKQVEAMGLDSVQLTDIEFSPLWDTGNRKELQRMDEHKEVFNIPAKDKVLFICLIYNSFPEIISSLICQTHQNWELRLIHDGPNSTGLRALIEAVNDPRITLIETPVRVGSWGHRHRQTELKQLNKSDADFVVVTNADNHKVPVYCEYMLKGFTGDKVAVYCSEMVHSYKAWQIIPCRLQRGYIDTAGFMVRRSVAHEIGWRDTESHSSDWTYIEDVIRKYGANKIGRVKGCLLIHN